MTDVRAPHPEAAGTKRSRHPNRGLTAAIAVVAVALVAFAAWAISERATDSGTDGAIAPQENTASRASADRLLFVGNSLTFWGDGVDTHVSELAASADPPMSIDADRYGAPGATLSRLWEMPIVLDGEVIGAEELIASGDYAVVVLQGDVSLPGNTVESFHEYARVFDTAISAAGAETVIFMHQRTADPVSLEEIAAANQEIATELGADLAPVGVAWQRAGEEEPELDLYAPDGTHGSVHGVYLAANVIYATLFGDTENVTYVPDGMTEEEASSLRRVAQETVEAYRQ